MMYASKFKIKLNPECKRALLNQAIRFHPWTRSDVSMKTKTPKFFNLLIISKSFLSCSRCFEVYCLRLNLPYRLNSEIPVHVLGEKNYFQHFLFAFTLLLGKLKGFIRLFRPAFFGVQQPDHEIHQYIKEVYKLLQSADGKIGLFFNENCSEICHLRLVEAFSSRINELKCPGQLLEDDSLPKLCLQNCEVFKLEGIGQLTKILRHDIRELNIKVDHSKYLCEEELNLIEENGSEAQVINTSVKSIELHCDNLSFHEIKDLASAILKFCPNLNNFYLYAAESELFPEFFDIEVTVRHALSQREKIMELKQILSSSRIKLHIKLKLTISGEDDHDFEDEDDDYWYIKDEKEFAGWKSRDSYKFYPIQEEDDYDDMPDDYCFGHNACSTYLTFEDVQCKLELEIINFIYGTRLSV